MHDPAVGFELVSAQPAMCSALSRLARRSKASWGYPPHQIEAWSRDLSFTPALLERLAVQVAVSEDALLGLIAIGGTERRECGEVAHLWVDPDAQRRGIGRALWQAGLHIARARGYVELRIESDPYAEGFYRKLGAQPIGSVPSPVDGQPERTLPLLGYVLQDPV